MTPNQRLERLKKETRLSNNDFAGSLGVNPCAISQYLSTKDTAHREISLKFNEKVKEVYGIDLYADKYDTVVDVAYVPLYVVIHDTMCIKLEWNEKKTIPVPISVLGNENVLGLKAFVFCKIKKSDEDICRNGDIIIFKNIHSGTAVIDGLCVICYKNTIDVTNIKQNGHDNFTFGQTKITKENIYGKVVVIMYRV